MLCIFTVNHPWPKRQQARVGGQHCAVLAFPIGRRWPRPLESQDAPPRRPPRRSPRTPAPRPPRAVHYLVQAALPARCVGYGNRSCLFVCLFIVTIRNIELAVNIQNVQLDLYQEFSLYTPAPCYHPAVVLFAKLMQLHRLARSKEIQCSNDHE
jgi:hypothetical protein